MTPRFVLVGLATELSLRPLAAALQARRFPVAVVDLAEQAPDASVVPSGTGPVVLVTSQHLVMNGPVYDAHSRIVSHYAAPQTLRSRLGADLLVYVPHDLAEPVLGSEAEALGTFDLFAAPDADTWWARDAVRTVVTGWVGTASVTPPGLAEAPLGRGVLFLSQVRWLLSKGGADFVLDQWPETLAAGLAVKLPVWPGLEAMSKRLAERGVELVAPSLAASAVAGNTPLVVTNAPSSVLAEAIVAGHRPVCVMHPEAAPSFAGQLAGLDVVVCRDETFMASTAAAGRVRPPSPGFDVDVFLHAVRESLEVHAR